MNGNNLIIIMGIISAVAISIIFIPDGAEFGSVDHISAITSKQLFNAVLWYGIYSGYNKNEKSNTIEGNKDIEITNGEIKNE